MPSDKATLESLRIDRSGAPRKGAGVAILVVLALLLLAAGGAYVWNWTPTPTVRTVVAVRAEQGGGQTLLNASGYVTARRQATVSSKITGKVVEVLIEEGMSVEAGQVLARLDASNVQRDLALAEARLSSVTRAVAETQPNLDQARRELARLEKLFAANAARQIELDRARTEVLTLESRLDRQRADVTVAQSEVALWKQQLDDTIIRAPFPGVVTSKDAQMGEMISPVSAGGGFTRTGICTLVDMGSLEIEVDVNESYINRVRSGQPVAATLDSYPQWRIPARVIAIIPAADRQKATVKVRVGFEERDERVLPDMSVKVAFQGEAPDQGAASSPFTLPRGVLRQREGRDVVFVVSQGKLERRAVTVAQRTGNEVTLTAGVNDGERLVLEGPAELEDGMRVKESQP